MSGSGPDGRRGGEHADAGGDGRETGVADLGADVADRVAAAVAELYGADPEAFTERRKALAAEAKAAGDKSAAAAITALRKPTRAAWVVNCLARAEPDAPARLAALAAALLAAEQGKDGRRLRELSADRGALLDALTARALAAASVPDPPSGLRDEVVATLTAVLADPETAAAFAAGTLTKAAHWSGFGFGFDPVGFVSPDDPSSPADGALSPADGAVSPADGPDPEPTRPRAPGRAPRAATSKRNAPGRPAPPPDEVAARRAAQQQHATDDRRQEAAAQRAAEQQQRLAQEAAEREAERRRNYEDMERAVASAATATAAAGSAEERLEAEVRDFEERLIQARADLAKARLRARHAEAAERRARQGLDRLPRP